jgi:hypothetical protein
LFDLILHCLKLVLPRLLECEVTYCLPHSS